MSEFQPKPFGKYYLIEKLAMGGMAEIFKAKTFGIDGFEKFLVIKRILPHYSQDQQFITMLTDEAKLSVLLSHHNIVQVFDLGKVGGDYFISMEFINGSNLRDLLIRAEALGEKLPEDIVVFIISEICKGLDYAHSRKDHEGKPLGIIHRDISPQNILLSYEGEVKIVDFGIAKAAMNVTHTATGIIKGKVSYISPEQVLGKPIDGKTDIFATGLLLYELLTGDKLFTGESHFEILQKIRTTHFTEKSAPDSVSETLRKILAKALAHSHKARYETAEEFQIDLTRYLYSAYPRFSPRRLSKLMHEWFSKEIEEKNAKRAVEISINAATPSLMAQQALQENIVHRDTAENALPAGSQRTLTFTSDHDTEPQTDPEIILNTGETLSAKTLAPRQHHVDSTATQPPASMNPTPVSLTPVEKKKRPYGALLFLAFVLLIALTGVAVGSYGVYQKYFSKQNPRQTPPLAPRLQPEAPQPHPPISQTRGTLRIESSPYGAQIFINDQETPYVTPSNVPGLELNRPQKITLKKAKYHELSQTLTLLDDKPVLLNLSLDALPAGSIRINSSPAGAKIFVDGHDTGQLSPYTLEDLELGKNYLVELKLNQYKITYDKISVFSEELIEFNKELVKINPERPRPTPRPRQRVYEPHQPPQPFIPDDDGGGSIHLN